MTYELKNAIEDIIWEKKTFYSGEHNNRMIEKLEAALTNEEQTPKQLLTAIVNFEPIDARIKAIEYFNRFLDVENQLV